MNRKMQQLDLQSDDDGVMLSQEAYGLDVPMLVQISYDQIEMVCEWLQEAKREWERSGLDRDEQELEFLDREQQERLNGNHSN